jgi:hypothetical protein
MNACKHSSYTFLANLCIVSTCACDLSAEIDLWVVFTLGSIVIDKFYPGIDKC